MAYNANQLSERKIILNDKSITINDKTYYIDQITSISMKSNEVEPNELLANVGLLFLIGIELYMLYIHVLLCIFTSVFLLPLIIAIWKYKTKQSEYSLIICTSSGETQALISNKQLEIFNIVKRINTHIESQKK